MDSQTFEKIRSELSSASTGIGSKDRSFVRRKLREAEDHFRQGRPCDRILGRLQRVIKESGEAYSRRRALLPNSIEYPEELPVTQRKDEILKALSENQVIIVAGSAGSGKTTQLPKICLEAGRGIDGRIGVTQPRRIAAMSVSDRVAGELRSALGTLVGYQVRFDANISTETAVKFMTDGLLLSEIPYDRELLAYDTIIVDEAHERSLNIDFLLGYLKQLLPKRPELKIIVSSATLDVEGFSEFFDGAPVIEVEGRAWPVEVRYRPPRNEDEPDYPSLAARAVEEIAAHDRDGDVLVFLSGEQEIREAVDLISGRLGNNAEVLPLFGRLNSGDQRRIFNPGAKRRVVISTNIAETSVTIPRVKYVVDSGCARVRRFHQQSQVENLLVERISRASSEQRKGRCGRVGPGVCVRLYSEEDFESRVEFTDPEILRSSLAGIILQMISLRLGKVEDFPFINPPVSLAIKRGYDELFELGSLTREKRLTQVGRRMTRLPVEPRFARMLLEGVKNDCLREILIIVAALSIQDPRERPRENPQEADSLHRRFNHEDSDFSAWLELWRFIERGKKDTGSNNRFRSFCKKNFLSYLRVREWNNLRDQLAEDMSRLGFSENKNAPDYEHMHRSIVAGLLSHTGLLTENKDYLGARSSHFHIFPGSGLFKKRPEWVVAGQLVRTSKLYARTVAKIDPVWIETIAGDLCKRSYANPFWDERSGCVRALETVTVYGLPIVKDRRSFYGKINPEESRKIFIEEALLDGRVRKKITFLLKNLELIEEVKNLENKARRTGIVVNREAMYKFYGERIPLHINTVQALEKWYYRERKRRSDLLLMCREDVQLEDPKGLSRDLFPDRMDTLGGSFPLSYRFDPGDAGDGVTVTIPPEGINELSEERLSWLVPGLLGEKAAMLIRSLPKRLRRELVPIPDTVDKVVPLLKYEGRELCDTLAEVLRKTSSVIVSRNDWRNEEVPDFLRMNVCVRGRDGKIIAQGRDLETIKAELGAVRSKNMRGAPKHRWEKTGATKWDFGELPASVDISGPGLKTLAYPAVIDEGETVGLKLFEDPREAERLHALGLRRLYFLHLLPQRKGMLKSLQLTNPSLLFYSALGGKVAGLENDFILRAIEENLLEKSNDIRSEEKFLLNLGGRQGFVNKSIYDLSGMLDTALKSFSAFQAAFKSVKKNLESAGAEEVDAHLKSLVYPGMVLRECPGYFSELPRFIKALELRTERLQVSPDKDKKKRPQVTQYTDKLDKLFALINADEINEEIVRAIAQYRFMLEEYRVSVYAQELGTSIKSSPKRLDKLWDEIVELARDYKIEIV